jgi:hypothetical protein
LTMWTFQNRESDEDAEDEVLALNDVLEAMTFRSHSTIEYFGLLQLKPDSYIYNLRWKVIENLYTTTVFKGEQKLPELIEPRLLECGGDGLFRFILKEDCGQCGEADAKLISPVLCIETDDIRVIDTIGLCELQFDETEGPYAPENSMGFAKLLGDGLYEIVSIAIGCCDEEVPPCPQIPGVPMGVIGVGADTIKWVLGFDEDGCLVRVPVGDCCTIEEDSSGIGEFFEGSSSIGGSEGEGEEEEEEEEEEPKGKT